MSNAPASMIGIDLGTSNSVAAHAGVIGQPARLLENELNEPSIPSVVSLRSRKERGVAKREILIGGPAVDNQPAAPQDTIRSVKRLMGRGYSDPQVKRMREHSLFKIIPPKDGNDESLRVVMGGVEYSPSDISALVLGGVKKGAEYRLGREVTHAVITVPAYFSEIQCKATRTAGRDANLSVIRLLKEPTAAALAYQQQLEGGEPKTVLVYDLGGGTFDISILTYCGTYNVENHEGDMWLGGDDFDDLLEQHVLGRIREDYEVDPTDDGVWGSKQQQAYFLATLRREVQRAKHRLGAATATDLVMPAALPGQGSVDISIERELFEKLITPLVDRTHEIVDRALKGAHLTDAGVDFVIMAGNSTTVPLVQRKMEQRFGVAKLLRHLHPKHCVAMGAAITAAGASGVLCECGTFNALGASRCACGFALSGSQSKAISVAPNDIAPFPYGVEVAGDQLMVFVKKGEPLGPKNRRTEVLRTRRAGQRIMCYPVWGGVHKNASANEKQGEAFAVLPPALPAETPVRVSLWLDGDGVFGISAALEDGTDLKPFVAQAGETFAELIKAVESNEQAYARRAEYLPPEELEQLRKKRDEVFSLLKERRAEQAGALLAEVEDSMRKPSGGDVERRAREGRDFARQVFATYGWLIPEEQGYALVRLVDELEIALKAADKQRLGQLLQKLDTTVQELPQHVQLLLQVRRALGSEVRSTDPAMAEHLNEALNRAEDVARQTRDLDDLNRVIAEIGRRVRAVHEQRSVRCSQAHLVPPGVRFCPTCNEDIWIADA